MKKILVLLANAFPFGTWEPFLETELDFLQSFDEIHIMALSVRPEQARVQREIRNPKVKVHPIPFRSRIFYAVNSVRVLGRHLLHELGVLVQQKRLTLSRVVTLLVFLSRARYEADQIDRILQSEAVGINDQVILYSYRMAYQPYLSSLVARRLNNPVLIARAHRADLYEEFAPHAYLPLRAETIEVLDRIYLISRHGLDYLAGLWPEAREKMLLSYLGTYDHGLGPESEDRSIIRLVTCSNIVPVKRLSLLIDGLAQINVPIVWTHFGDGPLSSEIVDHAHRALPDHVIADFRGSVTNSQLMVEYSRQPWHCFVNVSSSEGLPVSLMEACSFGIPVIATDVGSSREIAQEGISGKLLTPSPTPSDIAEAITEVAEMPDDDYSALRVGARKVWEANFRAETNYDQFDSDLHALLEIGRETC